MKLVLQKNLLLENGVQIIGKTGTGQMVDENGTYSSNNYTKSFAGMAPYDDPQIITLVVFQVKIIVQLIIKLILQEYCALSIISCFFI